MIFKKIISSNIIFGIVIAVFIFSLGSAIVMREGKDLRVGLFGVVQAIQKKSPYENPTDPGRPLFRYAPGFAILQYPFLLKSRMVAPFQFKGITPSALAWYFACVFSLLASGWILLKLIPAFSKEISLRNLKISFLMALPLIGYELSNGQNKLLALAFMLAAIYLFEKNRMFSAGIFFNLALTVYVALFPFLFYFLLKKKKFIISFFITAVLMFLILPSLFFGIDFNLYLLKEWFMRCLKPFFLTTSYTTYIDLRTSSQSLPSALARLFVSGKTGHFNYILAPYLLHILIRVFSAIVVFMSCLAVWRRPKTISQGMDYVIFLSLALILPQYCIYYTWAWSFVFYFAAFNYMSYPAVPRENKGLLIGSAVFLFISSWAISIHVFNYLSFLFWATMAFWLGSVLILTREKYLKSNPAPDVQSVS